MPSGSEVKGTAVDETRPTVYRRSKVSARFNHECLGMDTLNGANIRLICLSFRTPSCAVFLRFATTPSLGASSQSRDMVRWRYSLAIFRHTTARIPRTATETVQECLTGTDIEPMQVDVVWKSKGRKDGGETFFPRPHSSPQQHRRRPSDHQENRKAVETVG